MGCVTPVCQRERRTTRKEKKSADNTIFLTSALSFSLFFFIKGPSRSSRDGISLTIARKAERYAKHDQAERAIDAHEELKTLSSAERRKNYTSRRLLPAPSGRGRQEKQPGAELLPPRAQRAAGVAAMAERFQVPYTAPRPETTT